MKFEVINDKNETVMHTDDISCVYEKSVLNCMSKSGHKFKINGKITALKNISEKLKEIEYATNN